ncbi:MAG: hypothetical protein ACR2OZ_05090 [Verrucomicrobiales bacterium]
MRPALFLLCAFSGIVEATPFATPALCWARNSSLRPDSEIPFQCSGVNAAHARGLDLTNTAAVFDHVFSRLPSEANVLPTENYFYWRLAADGRELRGNFRLSPGQRDRGLLHFAYSEWKDFSGANHAQRLRRQQTFPVLAQGGDAFTWLATHGGKSVSFHLHRLDQNLPQLFSLASGERFVQRTFDESGLGFFLIFDQRRRRFVWLLNEEEDVAEQWRELSAGVILGCRTGFVFIQEQKRKRLIAVRGQSLDCNGYYDGPFDQLADNYAGLTPLRECLETWNPELCGRIDDCGRPLKNPLGPRVAIAPYDTYYTKDEAIRIGRRCGQLTDSD